MIRRNFHFLEHFLDLCNSFKNISDLSVLIQIPQSITQSIDSRPQSIMHIILSYHFSPEWRLHSQNAFFVDFRLSWIEIEEVFPRFVRFTPYGVADLIKAATIQINLVVCGYNDGVVDFSE